MVVLQAKALEKNYPTGVAVAQFGIEIQEGEVFGVFGPNGSGKSTLLKMLSGLMNPSSGRVRLFGLDHDGTDPGIKRRIGILSEDMGLIEVLTVLEHLELAGGAYGVDRAEIPRRAQRLVEVLDLENAQHKVPSQLSYGMGKKLALAMALMHNPRILFLDEPFEGIDPGGAVQLREMFRSMARRGVAILLSSHSLGLVGDLVDRFVILSGGTVAARGTREQLVQAEGGLEAAFFRCIPAREPQDLEWIV